MALRNQRRHFRSLKGWEIFDWLLTELKRAYQKQGFDIAEEEWSSLLQDFRRRNSEELAGNRLVMHWLELKAIAQ